MPAMLTDTEQHDVTTYLTSLHLTSHEPAQGDPAIGQQHYWSLGCAACHEQQGLNLTSVGSKTNLPALAHFLMAPEATDPSGVMPSLDLDEQEALNLAAFLMQFRNETFEKPAVRGEKTRGKAIVQSRGCLACHQLNDPAPLENKLTAPAFRALDSSAGCLSASPQQRLPRYALSGDERAALTAFIDRYGSHPDKASAPVYDYRRRVKQLRCVACHVHDNHGPSVPLTEAVPSLTVAGPKLRTTWAEGVLTGDKRVRAWLELRMPHFKSDVVAPLARQMAKASGIKPGDGPAAPILISNQDIGRGATMIGSDGSRGGLSCISCHDWGEYKSMGERGPQFINVAERVRFDWFRRWMHQPARILSGTSMPTYFSDRESADKAINRLWGALSLGDRMSLPAGIGPQQAAPGSEAMPRPGAEAAVIRWPMPESSPASIAVGLSNRVSYCFDAADCHLRYAWMGGFVDMTPTLVKSSPPLKILGEIFYRLNSMPFRLSQEPHIPETRFRGYRIIDGNPEFHYRVDGIDVFELIIPRELAHKEYRDAKHHSGGGPANRSDDRPLTDGFEHRFKLRHVDRPMWYFPGKFENARISADLPVLDDGSLSIPAGTEVEFHVTVSNPAKHSEILTTEQKSDEAGQNR